MTNPGESHSVTLGTSLAEQSGIHSPVMVPGDTPDEVICWLTNNLRVDGLVTAQVPVTFRPITFEINGEANPFHIVRDDPLPAGSEITISIAD